MTDRTTPFACACGEVSGHLSVRPPRGATHLVCHCDDCLTAEVAMGQPYPGSAGVAVVQTTPDRVHFESGADRLAILRLSPKGLYRWYAACCGVPLFNTPVKMGVPYVALVARRAIAPEDLGRVAAHVNAGSENRGALRAIPGIIGRTLAARVTGRWKQTPFFAEDGSPVAEAHVLTRAQRAAAAPKRPAR